MKSVQRSIQDYKDMLDMPHHVSDSRAQMPRANRAVQFAPFSAVVGYEAAVNEAARYTDQRKELDEMEKAVIDGQLRDIEIRLHEEPMIAVVYFEPDEKKTGGSYITRTGNVKKLDSYSREVVFMDEFRIAVEQIYSIEMKEE